MQRPSERSPQRRPSDIIIGIDLGTTCSSVSVMRNGRVEIIPDDQGRRTTPSCVAFTDSERLIGGDAANQGLGNPQNTIFGVKRLIGQRMSSPGTQADVDHFPFKCVEEKGRPLIEVRHLGETKRFRPEEISAMVLGKMKTMAEAFLGRPVSRAVVAVPSQFTDAQRRATKDAGAIAGLDVVRIVSESSAAAIAYGIERKLSRPDETNILVFDLGGGTLDIALVTVEFGVFEVQATHGSTHLGGDDFTQRLVTHFIDEFKHRTRKDISKSQRAIARLCAACERAKIALSSSVRTTIEIDSLFEGVGFVSSLSRARFEDLCGDLFRNCVAPIERVLSDAKLTSADVHDIVMVGGSVRIPKIQELVRGVFGGKEPCRDINPDEAVASGVAVQAHILGGQTPPVEHTLLLIGVGTRSIGIETPGGVMSNVVGRGCAFPVASSRIFSTDVDNQSSLSIRVFAGEEALTKDNSFVGVYDVIGISPRPRGVPQIEVKFDIDADGLMSVYAEETVADKKIRLEVDSAVDRNSREDMARMIGGAQRLHEHDRVGRELDKAKNDLEQHLYEARKMLRSLQDVKDGGGARSDSSAIAVQRSFVDDTISWVDTNPAASKRVYEAKLAEIKDVITSLLPSV